MRILILSILAVSFFSACNDISKTSYVDDTVLEKEQAIILAQKLKEEIANSPCKLPWNDDEIQAGESVKAYSLEETCDGICEENFIVRTCENGVLTGSNDFMFKSCRENVCSSCEMPWGGLLLHGQTETAYAFDERDFDETPCETPIEVQGSVTCNNGELDGIEEYPYGVCEDLNAACALPWDPDSFIPHNSSIDGYTSESVNCLTTCESIRENMTCSNGAWLDENGDLLDQFPDNGIDDNPYQFAACIINECRDCDVPGTDDILLHGNSQDSWNTDQPTCDFTCNDHVGTITCMDGELQGLNEFPSTTCAPANCQCTPPPGFGDVPVDHGESLTAYQQDIVACQSSCELGDNDGQITCDADNQVWLGYDVYSQPTCNNPCADCQMAGDDYEHGSQPTAYSQNESDCVDGTFTSNNCEDNTTAVTCSDGQWLNDNDQIVLENQDFFATCDSRICGCVPPWGGTINHNETVEAVLDDKVECGGSCQTENRTCVDTNLSGTYQHLGPCEEVCVDCEKPMNDGPPLVMSETADPMYLFSEGVQPACNESCEAFRASIQCINAGTTDNPQPIFQMVDDPNGLNNPNAMDFYSCSTGICTSGGNPPRGCALPGGFGNTGDDHFDNPSENPDSWTTYHSRFNRPLHLRRPNGDPKRTWIQFFELRGEQYPYGNHTHDGNDNDQWWYYHVSPNTRLTFYDTPVVDQRVNPEDSCDNHMLIKRCEPDGYWIADHFNTDQSQGLQDRGGIGPRWEPSDLEGVSLPSDFASDDVRDYKFPHCRTIPADYDSWTNYLTNLGGCLMEDGITACLVNKNPFFANGNAAPADDSAIENLQTMTVQTTDVHTNSLLQSESFKVFELFTYDKGFCQWYELVWDDQDNDIYHHEPRDEYGEAYYAELKSNNILDLEPLPIDPNVDHKIGYTQIESGPVDNPRLANERDYPALRVNLFYGLEMFKEKLFNLFGLDAIHFEFRSINVVQGDPLFKNNAAFIRQGSPHIVFGSDVTFEYNDGAIKDIIGKPYSVDLSVAAHELAHGNLFFATGINSRNGSTTQSCGPGDKNYCCTEVSGCYSAIDEGQADYFSAVIYPESPSVGDGIAEHDHGLSVCGIDRDVRRNGVGGEGSGTQGRLTLQDAFDACAGNDMPGQIHAMGAVYASIWWEFRQAQSNDTNKRIVDEIYLRHLKYLSSSDVYADTVDAVELAVTEMGLPMSWRNQFAAELNTR